MSNRLMKICLFADLHQTNSNRHYTVGQDGESDLLKRQKEFVSLISKNDADVFVNLGDTTDENIVDTYVLPALNDVLLGPIASSGKLYINLEGNHCITDGGNVYSILSSYRNQISSNVRLTVDQPSDIVLDVDGRLVYIRSIPYIGDYAKMREWVIKPLETAYNHFAILMFHAPCTNALMDNGFPASHGLTLEETDLDQYDLAIGGDFHRPQRFMVGDTPVYYCGAPFALTRGQNFPLGFRELEIFEDGSYTLEHVLNPFAVSISDIDWKDIDMIDSLIPESTILYVNDVPHAEKAALHQRLSSMGFYSFKIKVEAVKKSTVLSEARKERVEAHRKQDIRSLLRSVLTEEESQDAWVNNLINELVK